MCINSITFLIHSSGPHVVSLFLLQGSFAENLQFLLEALRSGKTVALHSYIYAVQSFSM